MPDEVAGPHVAPWDHHRARDDATGRSQFAAVIEEVSAQIDSMVEEFTATIESEVSFFRTGAVDHNELLTTGRTDCRAGMQVIHSAFLSASPDFSAVPGSGAPQAIAAATSARYARMGIPLPALLANYRIGSTHIWNAMVQTGLRRGLRRSELLARAPEVFAVVGGLVEIVATSYQAELTSMFVDQESTRSALIDALLDGRASASMTLWEIADLLGLPHGQHYVVVMADVAVPVPSAVDDLEAGLRFSGFASAWRLLPAYRIGIVALPHGPGDVPALAELLRSKSAARHGISAAYRDLGLTSNALGFARTALLGAGERPGHVVVFGDSPLQMTSVAAPDINIQLSRTVLAGLDSVGVEQRQALLTTLETWLHNQGSATQTADRLFLHRNTVRQRLARLQELTGRSLRDPRDIAELCIAVETARRLEELSPQVGVGHRR